MSLFEKYHYDESEDKLYHQRVHDVEPLLESNKRAYNDAGGFKSEIFNHKARIDLHALIAWLQVRGLTYHDFMMDEKILKQFLNDPDNRFFLTRPGKV